MIPIRTHTCLTGTRKQAFGLLVGRWRFYTEEGEAWRLEGVHLAKVVELT